MWIPIQIPIHTLTRHVTKACIVLCNFFYSKTSFLICYLKSITWTKIWVGLTLYTGGRFTHYFVFNKGQTSRTSRPKLSLYKFCATWALSPHSHKFNFPISFVSSFCISWLKLYLFVLSITSYFHTHTTRFLFFWFCWFLGWEIYVHNNYSYLVINDLLKTFSPLLRDMICSTGIALSCYHFINFDWYNCILLSRTYIS